MEIVGGLVRVDGQNIYFHFAEFFVFEECKNTPSGQSSSKKCSEELVIFSSPNKVCLSTAINQ